MIAQMNFGGAGCEESGMLRWLISVTGVAVALACSFFAQIAFAQISLESPILDRYAIELQSNEFKFDENGRLSSGLIRSLEDPIDYSSLLKASYLKSGFDLSVFRCSNGIGDCREVARKFPSTNLSFGLLVEDDFLTHDDYETLSNVGQVTLAATGFEVTPVHDTLEADIVLTVGSNPFLAKKLASITGQSRREILKQIDAHEFEGPLDMIFSGSINAEAFCYVSEAKWERDQQIFVFSSQDGLAKCLPQAMFNAIGIGPTWLDIPSITDISKDYSAATFSDVLFVRILYHPDIPDSVSLETAGEYWQQKSKSQWIRLIQELVLN